MQDRTVDDLSERERQIIQRLRAAEANKEIAYALGIAEGTVKQYVSSILRKLRMRNRTEVAIWASRTGPSTN